VRSVVIGLVLEATSACRSACGIMTRQRLAREARCGDKSYQAALVRLRGPDTFAFFAIEPMLASTWRYEAFPGRP
jgi:hypothetical protein